MQGRREEIVDAALRLLEGEGPDGVSMRRIADRVGIRAASIYKHFPNKDALEAAMISVGFERQAEAFERAGSGLGALTRAYRDFARTSPHLYRLMTERALNRDLLEPGVEDRAAAPVIAATGGDRDAARAAWAFAHGMTILELNERFPPAADLDAAWSRGLEAFGGQTSV
jgi:AcrR family transcriptional regulator